MWHLYDNDNANYFIGKEKMLETLNTETLVTEALTLPTSIYLNSFTCLCIYCKQGDPKASTSCKSNAS